MYLFGSVFPNTLPNGQVNWCMGDSVWMYVCVGYGRYLNNAFLKVHECLCLYMFENNKLKRLLVLCLLTMWNLLRGKRALHVNHVSYHIKLFNLSVHGKFEQKERSNVRK